MPPVQRAAALAAALLALLPAAAAAETPVVLGTGASPSAVTDAVGTLHAVWRAPGNTTAYCRVPAGGTTCAARTLPPPDPRFPTDPKILVRRSDGVLFVVVTGRKGPDDVTWRYTSADGGSTWAGPELAGVGQYDLDDVQLTPDGQAIETGYVPVPQYRFQRVPVAGGPETRFADLGAGTPAYVGSVSLARTPDGRPMAVGSAGGRGVRARVLGGDPHDAGAWSPWAAVPELKLNGASAAAGPSGTYLLGDALGRLRVFRWDGRRFARPRTIGTLPARTSAQLGRGEVGRSLDLQSDAAGRLHAVWVRSNFDCGGMSCFVYRRSEPRDFGPEVVYPVERDPAKPITALQAAPNEGGSGWVVMELNAVAGPGNIRAVPLVTPPRGSRVGSLVIGRRTRVTVPTRYGCVPVGGRFVHRVDVTGRRAGVRILRVRFSFDDGQLARTDRRAPFRSSYVLGFPAGTRHVARAQVTYRFRGRTRTAGIGRMVVMCP